ncbi:MAG: dynamin family protein [Trinickia sp.]|uniref:dynamin family protein n=1 Tax=Trinickia sp. TaxID=2571163 RepID=UPI003F81422F
MNKIEALKEEAIRLIGLQKDLLRQIKEKIPTSAMPEEDEVRDGDDVEAYAACQFTPEAIDRKIKALDENLIKTRNLDMVLAVVGTMKAGKSTCINAIVGQEILPNRNRPMTALPTLIRHKPGAATPVLHFGESKQGPVLALVQQMQKVLAKKDHSGHRSIAGDADLLALSKAIGTQAGKSGYKLKARYEGEEGIFAFLKGLNDLVRLAKELGLRFPFEHYTSIADFPEIEVEFFHLKDAAQDGTLGNFALLDTPGFNEAGQSEHLLPMLTEQLEKATAVLAVLDYTQLKSESEAQLRKELEEIAAFSGERMFCLVNKFDQHNSNSDDADATRAYVAGNLLEKVFGPEVEVASRIFPVSGQQAYLAKRAELEIERHGSLGWQAGQKESWVDTFGDKAFGLRYSKFINDREEVAAACKDLWARSRFDAPLVNAVRYSHNNAARMAIQAAVAKLGEIAGEDGDTARGIGAMLNLRLQGLDLDAEQIERLIADLNAKLKSLGSRKAKVGKKLDDLVNEVRDNMKTSLKGLTKEVKTKIKAAFEANAQQPEGEPSAIGKGRKSRDAELVLEVQDVMEFGVEAEAQVYLGRIADEFKDYLEGRAEALFEDLNNVLEDSRKEFTALRTMIQKDISEFEEHAAEAGLDGLKISVPKASRLSISVDAGDGGGHLLKDKSYTTTRYRDQDGFFAKVKRGVGSLFRQDDWGRDEYKAKVNRYVFTKADLEEHYDNVVKVFNADLTDIVESKVNTPMQANKEALFASITDAFGSIRESLDAGRKNQSESKERQAEIRATVHALQQQLEDNVEDIRQLSLSVKKLATA